jgi:hypothetical protein
MNAEREKAKARTLARKQARKLKRELAIPVTQQTPAKPAKQGHKVWH